MLTWCLHNHWWYSHLHWSCSYPFASSHGAPILMQIDLPGPRHEALEVSWYWPVQYITNPGDGDHGISSREAISAWWLTYPSEKYDFVSWDDDYSQYMEKKMFQTTNQIWIVKRIITATEISLTISHSISGYTSQKKNPHLQWLLGCASYLVNGVRNPQLDEHGISPILDGMKYWLD